MWRKKIKTSSLQFKTKQDFAFSGRSIKTHSESVIDFSFDKSLYADDKAKCLLTQRERYATPAQNFGPNFEEDHHNFAGIEIQAKLS